MEVEKEFIVKLDLEGEEAFQETPLLWLGSDGWVEDRSAARRFDSISEAREQASVWEFNRFPWWEVVEA